MIDVQGEISREPPMIQRVIPSKAPGILLCPEQTTMSKDKEISFLDEHSRDCGPTDRINGEIKEPTKPIEIK